VYKFITQVKTKTQQPWIAFFQFKITLNLSGRSIFQDLKLQNICVGTNKKIRNNTSKSVLVK